MRVCLAVLAACLVLPTAASIAQQPGPAGNVSGETFSSDPLQLRFTWKTELDQQNPRTAFSQGVLSLPGVSHTTTSDGGQGTPLTSCLRPSLLLESPFAQKAPTAKPPSRQTTQQTNDYATVLLAELDLACVSPADKTFNGPELPSLAQLLLASPGMTQRSAPNGYKVGNQPVVMVQSQGHPMATAQNESTGAIPFTLYTMVVGTKWNNHNLFWILTASSVDRLDQLSKSTVQFGQSAAAAALYPEHISTAGAIGPPARH